MTETHTATLVVFVPEDSHVSINTLNCVSGDWLNVSYGMTHHKWKVTWDVPVSRHHQPLESSHMLQLWPMTDTRLRVHVSVVVFWQHVVSVLAASGTCIAGVKYFLKVEHRLLYLLRRNTEPILWCFQYAAQYVTCLHVAYPCCHLGGTDGTTPHMRYVWSAQI